MLSSDRTYQDAVKNSAAISTMYREQRYVYAGRNNTWWSIACDNVDCCTFDYQSIIAHTDTDGRITWRAQNRMATGNPTTWP
jgi:hypothetical protein